MSDLQRWLDDESAANVRYEGGVGPGVATPDDVRSRTGLELLRGMLAGELPFAPIARTLDYVLLDVGEGRAVFQGTPRAEHFNPMGTVHGGWITTLLDSALGCAVHAVLPAGRAYTTTDLSVRFVRPLTPHVPRVRAEGTVVHAGRQIATSEARLYGPDGKLYAHGTCTCLCFDLP